ncbi:hypothetical protein [Pseudomonas sp. B392_1p]|uniref:hypothetical protein n=1 Tax=Pseudomonas sp. B392_1p TaxID=3457507 RepID=UPI003FD289B3
MSNFENFVQCRVVTPFTAAATEIGLFAADDPHRLPAEGGGVVVLTDSPYRPSILEVIRYGRRSGLALYEVSRAQEGTAALDWTGVAFCYQALTAGELEQLMSKKADVSALDGLREEAEIALAAKVDKITGKGLSTNDYTTAEKNKLAHANLTALVGLAGAADRLPYFTGAGALSLATITAAARTFLAATNVAGQQSALGLFADASGVMTNASGALTNWVSQFLRSADAASGRSQMGLGTAALLTAATDRLDATLGRAVRIGDVGVGQPVLYAENVDDVGTFSAWYYTSNLCTGLPAGFESATKQGYLWHQQHPNPLYATQYWVNLQTERTFQRTKSAGTWRAWVEVFNSGNQLSLGTTVESARSAMGIRLGESWAGDLNTLRDSGSYIIGRSSSTNVPDNLVGDPAALVFGHQNRPVQLLHNPTGSGGLTIRASSGWGGQLSWTVKHLYDNRNILGPVSHSAGVPTGAIIESGSNANGSYWRYAGGMQICTHKLNVESGVNVHKNWVYPAPFSEDPNVYGSTVQGSTTDPANIGFSVVFNSHSSLYTKLAFTSPSNVSSHITAIGRWY